MINSSTELENLHVSPPDAKPVLYAGAVDKARISIYNEDCLQALKAMADKQFDLAIVDPPYGIGADGTQGFATKKQRVLRLTKRNTQKRIGIVKYQMTNIFLNCKEYLKIKLFGVLITLLQNCHI